MQQNDIVSHDSRISLEKYIDFEAESLINHNQLIEGKINPEEPAKLVLFLASNQSTKITKQIINVDAGWV